MLVPWENASMSIHLLAQNPVHARHPGFGTLVGTARPGYSQWYRRGEGFRPHLATGWQILKNICVRKSGPCQQ